MGARRVVVVAGFAAALAARVLLLRSVSGNYDVDSFAGAVAILHRGGDVYLETTRYNYSPAWAQILLVLDFLARKTGCTFATALGGLLLAVDVLTAAVLYRIAGRGSRGTAAALLFFANPVSIFVSSFHLQFDNLAILFLLAAVVAAQSAGRSRWTAAALSASLVAKHFTAFFPPLFLAGRRRAGLTPLQALVPYAVFAASFVPYWRSWAGIRRNVVGYRSLAEDYGVAMLRAIPGAPAWLPMAAFLLAMAAAVVLLRRVASLPRACLMLFLAMLLFAPGICEYYFVWPIALGSLFGGAGYAVYTVVVSAFFLGSPDGLGLPLTHLPGWHGVWWSLLLWLAWEIRRAGNEPAAPERAS